jgi:hypothetical protein
MSADSCWEGTDTSVEWAAPWAWAQSPEPLSPQAVGEGLQAKLGDTVAPTIGRQAAHDAGDVDHPALGLL